MNFKPTLPALLATTLLICTANVHAESSASSQPSGEGISVHGHWRLEFINPDGSLDRVVEFDNEFLPEAAESLSNVLMGKLTPGSWEIYFANLLEEQGPCLAQGNVAVGCSIVEAEVGSSGPSEFANLTIELVGGSGDTPFGLKLHGTATAAMTAPINYVMTRFRSCTADVAPENCVFVPGSNAPSHGFTRKQFVDTPEQVAEGQTVSVTVTISFS